MWSSPALKSRARFVWESVLDVLDCESIASLSLWSLGQAATNMSLARRVIFIAAWAPILASAQTAGDEQLDAFYSEQFTTFLSYFAPHIQTLDQCLKEMDEWQKNVFTETPTCHKWDEEKLDARTRLEELEPVMVSYAKWIDSLQTSRVSGGALKASPDEVNAMVEMFAVKLQQVQARSKRVQQQEAGIIRQLNDLVELSEEAKRREAEVATLPAPE